MGKVNPRSLLYYGDLGSTFPIMFIAFLSQSLIIIITSYYSYPVQNPSLPRAELVVIEYTLS